MNRTKAFLKLDFLTVKQNLRPGLLLFYTGLLIIQTSISNDFTLGLVLGVTMSISFLGMPFAISEKNDLDMLYLTLGVDKKKVVFGRYLFAIISTSIITFLSFIVSLAGIIIKNKALPDFNLELFLVVVVMFALGFFIQSIDIPMYFKLAYTKARLFSIFSAVGMLIVVIGTAIVVSNISFENDFGRGLIKIGNFLAENRIYIALLVLAFVGLCLFISYKFSVAYYKKRQF